MTNWFCQHGVLIPGSCADCFRDRRDRFAAAALTGMLANDSAIPHEQIVEWSVKYADDMIVALDKPVKP